MMGLEDIIEANKDPQKFYRRHLTDGQWSSSTQDTFTQQPSSKETWSLPLRPSSDT